ncbi:YicC/YloC family endoribonuclease [Halobacillus sp. MO56]
MVTSMTGYGRKTMEFGEARLSLEVRSVNHRFLDISTKMPRTFLFLEDKMKKVIQQSIHRGKVDVFVTIEGEGLGKRELKLDWDLADQYFSRLKELKSHYELTGDLTVDMVTKLEDVFLVQEQEHDEKQWEQHVLTTLEAAVLKLMEMRKREGDALKRDMLNRLSNIKHVVDGLGERREVVIETYRERIKQRIEEYTQEELQVEDSRILQEVALLAEKGDITEEITRLFSHIEQFVDTLEKPNAIGRRLDFIVQEMHREVNTIGSKSNDAKISEWVVLLKSEIEKIKEQVQNVE